MSEEKGNEQTSAHSIETASDLPDNLKQVIADAKAKHGNKIAYWYDEDFGLLLIVRRRGATGEANYNRLVNELHDGESDRAVALRTFALSCVEYPPREQAKKIFEDNPAFALKVATRAQQLAGAQVKELGKA